MSSKKIMNVVINGAAGNIAFSLIPLFCNGLVFGPNVKISLRLLEIPQAQNKLKGTIMEIEDGAYPFLDSIYLSVNPKEALKNADVCVFIASYPHYAGMERHHLLQKNVDIYHNVAENLNTVAHRSCKVVVVANPVNSLTSMLCKFAPNIPEKNFTALSRLDHNRARFALAKRCGVGVESVANLVVWGNHGDTQYPDSTRVKINGVPIHKHLIGHEEWLKGEFIHKCAQRWKRIVDTRGLTRYIKFFLTDVISIMSPSAAIKDHLWDWYSGTTHDNVVSMGVISDGRSYGVPKGMCFSMPCETKDFEYKVKNYDIDDFTKDKHKRSIEEIYRDMSLVGFKL